jgi:crotonobetaine/carnitine-CoA ligase
MELNPAILAHAVEIKARERPDFPVLTFDYPDHTETVSYASLWAGAQHVAGALAEAGVGFGDRFALVMRNHPQFAHALVAASLAGTVCVPVDPRSKGAKLRYVLEHSRARAVLCTTDLAPAVLEAVGGASTPILVTRPMGPPSGAVVLEWTAARPLTAQRVTDPRTPWQILYTSGTTGDPKGVVCDNGRFGVYAAVGKLVFDYRDDEVLYTGLSLTHGNAQAVTFASAVAHSLPAVISERFTKSRLWDVCRRHGCTTFSLLGGMATAIYGEPPRPDDRDHRVRFVVSAGMPRALWEDFERRFGVKILEWYGAVDGGIAFKPIGVGPVGSFGRPFPGMEMRIVDDGERECVPGEVGELVCRWSAGPTVIEYLDDPGASAAKTRGGWIRTGDMCHRDAEGWLFFDWRRGGGLRHNGDFILPDWVERAAIEHPDVSDACCYGVPARSGAPGESDVVLALVPRAGVRLDGSTLYAHLKERLEPNCVPSFLQIVAEIPKTISEKPQARLLQERFAPDAPGVCRHEDVAHARRTA